MPVAIRQKSWHFYSNAHAEPVAGDSLALQDNAYKLTSSDQILRIRVTISNTGSTTGSRYVGFGYNTDNGTTWTKLASGAHFNWYNGLGTDEQAVTSNLLDDSGTGKGWYLDDGSSTGQFSFTTVTAFEFDFCIQPTANAVPGQTYYFSTLNGTGADPSTGTTKDTGEVSIQAATANAVCSPVSTSNGQATTSALLVTVTSLLVAAAINTQTVTLPTTNYLMGANNPAHVMVVSSPEIVQEGNLVISPNSCTNNQTASNPSASEISNYSIGRIIRIYGTFPVTQGNPFVATPLGRAPPQGEAATNVTVQPGISSQTVTSPIITGITAFSPTVTVHSQTITSPTIQSKNQFSPDSSTHSETVTSPIASEATIISPISSVHSQGFSTPTITTTGIISPNSCANSQTSSSPSAADYSIGRIVRIYGTFPVTRRNPFIAVPLGRYLQAPSGAETVTVQGAGNSQTVTSPIITGITSFSPAEAIDSQTATQPSIGQKNSIQPIESTNAITSDSPSISTGMTVNPDNTSDAVSSSSPAIGQIHVPSIISATNTQISTSPSVIQINPIQPTESTNTIGSTSPSISAGATANPDGGTNSISSTQPTINQVHIPSIASATNTQTSTSPSIIQTTSIQPAGSTNSIASDSPSLSAGATVNPNASSNAVSSTQPTIIQIHLPFRDSATNIQSATSPSVIGIYASSPVSTTHSQTVSSPSLSTGASASPSDCSHSVSSTSPTINQKHIPSISSSTNLQSGTSPNVVQVYGITPNETTNQTSSTSPATGTAISISVTSGTHLTSATLPSIDQKNIISPSDCEHEQITTESYFGAFDISVKNASHAQRSSSPSVAMRASGTIDFECRSVAYSFVSESIENAFVGRNRNYAFRSRPSGS